MSKEEGEDHQEQDKTEKALLKAISEGDLQTVVNIVSTSESLNVNCTDENGMSPLQHAAYKGNLKMAKFFLERGADVNQNDHEHRYSALMFAALGGHTAVLSLLLEHGANIDAINSVGRNASQMAGFVGQHRSVAVINNFISRDTIEYYSKISGLEKTPRLSVRFISPVHALVRLVNVHPVRILYFFKSNLALFEEPKMIHTVLELLSEKLMRNNEPKEMLSLKVHYLNFIFWHVQKAFSQSTKSIINEADGSVCKETAETVLHTLAKSFLKLNNKGFPEGLERLLRQIVRSYPFQENAIFQQLVQTLSTVEIGDEPSALSILSQAIIGKGPDSETDACYTCGELSPDKRCSKCKVAMYCDVTCQRLHWNVHKLSCDQLLAQYKRDQLAEAEHQRHAEEIKAQEAQEAALKAEASKTSETVSETATDNQGDQDSKENTSPNEVNREVLDATEHTATEAH